MRLPRWLPFRSRSNEPKAALRAVAGKAGSCACFRGRWESIEATLAGWWQDLLGVDQVNPDDDFFALGGHSLIGVRMFAKIKKTYQVRS